MSQRGNETNYPALQVLKALQVPVTLENYLEVEFPEGIPEDYVLTDEVVPPELLKGQG